MPTLPPARTPFGGRESHQAREIAESFGSDADRYDRARPRYPDELVDRIVAGAAPEPEAVRRVVTTVIAGVIRDDIPGPVPGG